MPVKLELGDKTQFAILMRARRSTVDKIKAGGPDAAIWRDALQGLDRQIADMVYRAFWEMPENDERARPAVTMLRAVL